MSNFIHSRIELFLEAIKTGKVSNLPTPQSRVEYFLKGIATGDVSNLPTPQSRIEYILNHIAINGGAGGGTSPNPPQTEGDWTVKKNNLIERILTNKNELNFGNDDNVVVSCISSGVNYLFAKEQEVLFNKEDNFVFNGEIASNDNTTKFCILSNDTDIQALPYEEFEGGRVHSINLKNNIDNNIFSEDVKDADSRYIIDEASVTEKINVSEMIATGYSIDDGNTTYNINCGFKIGNRTVSKVYIEGNCVFALRDSNNNNILYFRFASTDGRVDNFYYKEEQEYCIYTWTGRSRYSGSGDLEVQVRLFKNGMFDILQSKTYANAGAYVTIGETSENITYDLKQNVSYVFYPSQDNGLDYSSKIGSIIVEPSYILFEDEGTIKHYNKELNSFVDTGSSDLTKDLFMEYGCFEIPNTREGLISNEPLLKIYEEKDYIPSYILTTNYTENRWYKLELKDFYDVSEHGLSNIVSNFTLDEFSDVRVIINKNNEGWFAFNGTEWESIDINSSDEITNKAMTMEIVNSIPQNMLEDINSFKFALFAKKLDKNSSLKINSIIFNYINPKVEEVKG